MNDPRRFQALHNPFNLYQRMRKLESFKCSQQMQPGKLLFPREYLHAHFAEFTYMDLRIASVCYVSSLLHFYFSVSLPTYLHPRAASVC